MTEKNAIPFWVHLNCRQIKYCPSGHSAWSNSLCFLFGNWNLQILQVFTCVDLSLTARFRRSFSCLSEHISDNLGLHPLSNVDTESSSLLISGKTSAADVYFRTFIVMNKTIYCTCAFLSPMSHMFMTYDVCCIIVIYGPHRASF